ncbi:MAG: BREX system ATP-binding domain-containing protein [Actinomycetota bacterium]
MSGVRLSEWLDLVSAEYLDTFVREGGAAVKFALAAGEETSRRLADELVSRAKTRGYVTAEVDAATTRLHMIQDVFFAVSQEIPWLDLVEGFLARAYEERGFQAAGGDLRIGAVAAANGTETNMLRQELRAALHEKLIKRGDVFAKDFRWAMFGLAATQAGLVPDRDLASLIEWLRGELRLVSAVKDFDIFRKIARHNAREMLASLGGWCRMAGLPGLVVILDLRQLAIAKRTEVPPDTLFYTRLAMMDCYEVLRQLIDDTDDFTGTLIVAIADPGLLDPDARRGVRIYRALEQRIWPDVVIREHPNPLSSLVSIEDGR